MFLVGGPAYSGTTLLALLLNQQGVTCLSEPDFHDPKQNHNGLPCLERLYPEIAFPSRSHEPLTYPEAFELMGICQCAIEPDRLGFKFCNQVFIDFTQLFKTAGYPVVAIIRDIRDVLVRPLLPYVGGETGLIGRYQMIWKKREYFDLLIRYEDLVTTTDCVIDSVSSAIGCSLTTKESWKSDDVPASMMYPRYRHYLLESGKISEERVGVWKTCEKKVSQEAHQLAEEMGY